MQSSEAASFIASVKAAMLRPRGLTRSLPLPSRAAKLGKPRKPYVCSNASSLRPWTCDMMLTNITCFLLKLLNSWLENRPFSIEMQGGQGAYERVK